MGPFPVPLQFAGHVADAAVRALALTIMALALVIPVVVTLLVAVFRPSAQDYAYALLERVVELFRTILSGVRMDGT